MSDETMTQERPVETIGDPSDDPKNLVRASREMIPVGNTGVAPLNFAQQIDYAQTMAKARAAIPKHLQGNVGDCLAVIDISTRAGLSPYMVASKTYVQNERLCFESQLFHAFAQASGLLKGDLMVDYEGEGAERVCIVRGFLKGDPTLREHRSPPLKDLHPGYTLKKTDGSTTSKKPLTYVEGQKMKQTAAGASLADGELFSKGSPLWDRKPDVQMFYDTSRDWVRMFAPRATLGIYTPDEVEEYGPDLARDVTPSSGLHERLTGAKPSTKEGHKPGHADSELDQIAEGGGKIIESKAEPMPAAVTVADNEKLKRKAGTKTKTEPAADKPEQTPTNAAEYVPYATGWIKAATEVVVMGQRWSAERKMRNDCGVTAADRKPLEDLIDTRRAELDK